MNLKKTSLVLVSLLFTALLTAQRQYDYYDDSAVAGGADRAFNGLVILVLLVIGAIVLLFLGNAFYKIYYGLNPEASPEYKAQKAKDERQRLQKEKEKQNRTKATPKEIDLGLSVKWCSINYGKTNSPYNVGGYYKWGELHLFDAKSYDLFNRNFSDIGDINGNPEYDIVSKNWSNGWRIPTKNEMLELVEKCTWKEVETKPISGYNITGPNGNSIFLPFTGFFNATWTRFSDEEGCYWTSTPKEELTKKFNQKAYSLSFGGWFNPKPSVHCERTGHHAIMIRPVRD